MCCGVELPDFNAFIKHQDTHHRMPTMAKTNPFDLFLMSATVPATSDDSSSSPVNQTQEPFPKKQTCFYCSTTESLLWDDSKLNKGEKLCDKCFFYELTHSRPPPPSHTGGLMSRVHAENTAKDAGDGQKRRAERRLGQACDQCRRLKIKCKPIENSVSCESCQIRDQECEYMLSFRRRRRQK
jgi:hypothetical protein